MNYMYIGVMLITLMSPATFAASDYNNLVSGVAKDSCDRVRPQILVRLRNVNTGIVMISTRTNERGEFRFADIVPAQYVVEIVENSGKTIGVSEVLDVVEEQSLSGVAPHGSAVCAAALPLPFFTKSKFGYALLGAGLAATISAVIPCADCPCASPSR